MLLGAQRSVTYLEESKKDRKKQTNNLDMQREALKLSASLLLLLEPPYVAILGDPVGGDCETWGKGSPK